MEQGYYRERLTPTYTTPTELVIAGKYGIHFLVDYVKGTGTETSISIKVQYKFNGDDTWRDRHYLDGQDNAVICEENYLATEFHTFISVPTMQSAQYIRLVATFNGYISGNYGSLIVSYRRESEQRP